MTIICCKECEKRFLGCHDRCTVFQKRLKEYHAEQQAIREMYAPVRSTRTIKLTHKGAIKRYK